MIGETATRRRENKGFPPALRQLGPEEFLQLTDLATDLTLPHDIARGRLCDAAGLGHFEETAEPVERETAMGKEGLEHDSVLL
jgi:hypothetical protein